MRLNSRITLLGFAVAMAGASVGAAELHGLPRCVNGIKVIHSELAPLEIHHPRRGRVDLEFTIDALGYVSDPVVVRSTAPRLDKEAMASVVLWRYEPPSSKCRHRASISYEFKHAEDA